MRTTVRDRILLLLTALLAAYQIAVGIEGLESLPVIAYTVAFGVLLVASVLILILGMDVLESPIVVVVSTIIPLGLALGMAWEWLPALRSAYLAFAIAGLTAVLVTRFVPMAGTTPGLVLAVVHAVAGLTIFFVPLLLVFSGRAEATYALVGLGGGLMGLGGLLLSFLRAGRPLLPEATLLRILPALLMLTTATFVAGFAWG